jgi:hypothetical protein
MAFAPGHHHFKAEAAGRVLEALGGWSPSISIRLLTPRELTQLSGTLAALPFFQDLLLSGKIKAARHLVIRSGAQITLAKPYANNNVATLNYHISEPFHHWHSPVAGV